MWSLTKPNITLVETFELCIEKIRRREFKSRMVGIKHSVSAASERFELAIVDEEVHLIQRLDLIQGTAGSVTAKEMSSIYKNRFADRQGNARALYDKLISRATRCPLCGHNEVSTLDHHLPKALYPALAVTPLNLVPSCGDCNDEKGEKYPASPDQRFIHPYFDNIDDGQTWLVGRVIQTSPASIQFSVVPPSGWPGLLQQRLKTHFRELKLGKLYGSQASTIIAGKRLRLEKCFNRGGENAVREELEEEVQTWQGANQNCWQVATFRALAGSAWYCREGYKLGMPTL